MDCPLNKVAVVGGDRCGEVAVIAGATVFHVLERPFNQMKKNGRTKFMYLYITRFSYSLHSDAQLHRNELYCNNVEYKRCILQALHVKRHYTAQVDENIPVCWVYIASFKMKEKRNF